MQAWVAQMRAESRVVELDEQVGEGGDRDSATAGDSFSADDSQANGGSSADGGPRSGGGGPGEGGGGPGGSGGDGESPNGDDSENLGGSAYPSGASPPNDASPPRGTSPPNGGDGRGGRTPSAPDQHGPMTLDTAEGLETAATEARLSAQVSSLYFHIPPSTVAMPPRAVDLARISYAHPGYTDEGVQAASEGMQFPQTSRTASRRTSRTSSRSATHGELP